MSTPLSIKCWFGRTSKGLTTPSLSTGDIETFFAQASRHQGRSMIAMTCDTSELSIPNLRKDDPVSAYELHKHLSKITRNPLGAGHRKVANIAVIYASSYYHEKSLFGVMFDRGWRQGSGDIVNVRNYNSTAREGCAVFLGAIADEHSGATYEQTVFVTVLHELGHVFNLGHLGRPPSLMAKKINVGSKPVANPIFDEGQKLRLCDAGDSPNVWPGGSEYGKLGQHEKLDGEDFDLSESVRSQTKADFGLELLLDMDSREFFAIEPVELEITVQVIPGVDRRFRIPDTIDPGYSTFNIWVETPYGERLRYRPLNQYCARPSYRTVTPQRPFERDLSIFARSGGYTFQQCGVHRLWATFDLGRRGVLRSNTLDVNVLPMRPATGSTQGLLTALSARDAARLLFYRDGTPGGEGERHLTSICEEHRNTAAAAAAHYALGRMYCHRATRAGKKEITKLEGTGRDHLERAADHQRLSPHRRDVARHLTKQ
jgi:hypothetical protein